MAVMMSSPMTFKWGLSGLAWFVVPNGFAIMAMIPLARILRRRMPQGFRGWLFQIARNTAIDFRNEARRVVPFEARVPLSTPKIRQSWILLIANFARDFSLVLSRSSKRYQARIAMRSQ
jgi:DNA-directed RNA polymerase specialized sigma24 family protein